MRPVNLLGVKPHIARLGNLTQEQVIRLAVPSNIHLEAVDRGIPSERTGTYLLFLLTPLWCLEISIGDELRT